MYPPPSCSKLCVARRSPERRGSPGPGRRHVARATAGSACDGAAAAAPSPANARSACDAAAAAAASPAIAGSASITCSGWPIAPYLLSPQCVSHGLCAQMCSRKYSPGWTSAPLATTVRDLAKPLAPLLFSSFYTLSGPKRFLDGTVPHAMLGKIPMDWIAPINALHRR